MADTVQRRADSEPDFGTIVLRTTHTFATNYPKVTAAYVIGLAVLLFSAGHAVDAITKAKFENQMAKVEQFTYSTLETAWQRKDSAYRRYYDSKGWFSCDSHCTENYRSYMIEEENYAKVSAERDALAREARKTVGLWSSYGVEDARKMFWDAWERGKAVAKRMSWWDAIFVPMRASRRDEDGIATLLRFLGQVLLNFTIGLCVHTISFGYNLIWFVRDYEAGLGGVLFFGLAMCGAFAMLVTYLLGMFGVFAGGAYMVVKVSNNAAIQNGQGGRGGQHNQRRRVQYGNVYNNRYQ